MASPLPYFTNGVRLPVQCEALYACRSDTQSIKPGDPCRDYAVATFAGKRLCFPHLVRAGGSIPRCGSGCLCRYCERWRRIDRKAAVVR